MEIDSLRPKRFCEVTGWTEKAIQHMIANGTWLDGREYTRMDNRRILISVKGYENWVSKSRKRLPHSMK